MFRKNIPAQRIEKLRKVCARNPLSTDENRAQFNMLIVTLLYPESFYLKLE